MSDVYYEIVQLSNGEVALQRVGDESEQLVRVSFSDEVKYYLQDQYLDVAKAMINTGIRIVGQIQNEADDEQADEEDPFETETSDGSPTLH